MQAFRNAVAMNKAIILAFLSSMGPQSYDAIRAECTTQAFGDHASVQAALRDLEEAGQLEHEEAWDDVAKCFELIYEVAA